MAYRDFEDGTGRRWMAWDTYPQSETLTRVRSDYARGWLSFECAAERRRYAPVPEGWEGFDDGRLCALLTESVAVVRARFHAAEATLPPVDA
jgi:hypothetical protein